MNSAKTIIILLIGVFFSFGCANSTSIKNEQEYDFIIKNGRMLDGTGTPWYRTDIAISGDRIVKVGDLSDGQAKEIIDAGGLYVAPGFIDTHSHAYRGLPDQELSYAKPLLAQGITSIIVNPDGLGTIDLEGQEQALTEHGLGVNVAQFISHGRLRRDVVGDEDRVATDEEMQQMKDFVDEAMRNGAVGISTGLFYTPGGYAPTEEIVELAAVAQKYGGVHQSHVRDESDYSIGVVASVDEVIEISRQSGIRGVVSHIKCLGPNVWGYSEAIVHRIDRARDEGLEIFADQYPYTASATGLAAALIPDWALDGGRSAFLNRLDNPEIKERIREGMLENIDRRGGAHRIQFRHVRQAPEIEGLTLDIVAENNGVEPVDMALELLSKGLPSIVSHNMHDRDVNRFMRQPWTMTASDGSLVAMGDGVPHPRNYGSFPRKIRKYVFEDEVVSLEFAIRTMTHMPAAVYRLEDRGAIRESSVADIVIFDAEKVNDPATYIEPHQLSEGMEYVWVNGKPAIYEGEFTRSLSGGMIKRNVY